MFSWLGRIDVGAAAWSVRHLMLLSNQVAVVTGCNRGIGNAILEIFAAHGADIWACARAETHEFVTNINSLADTYGVNVRPVYFNLRSIAEVKQSAKMICAEASNITILVNNAGVIDTAPFQMTSIEQMNEMYAVNFLAPIVFSQYIARKIARNQGGSIVNISSSAALDGNEGRLAYGASKAALISATRVMARELASYGVRANTIAPGLTNTDMMVESTSNDAIQHMVKHIALARCGDPREIANVALFLASSLSSYMTGQVLRVDGGLFV